MSWLFHGIAVFALLLLSPSAHAQQRPEMWSPSGQFRGHVDRNGNMYRFDGGYLGHIDRRGAFGAVPGESYANRGSQRLVEPNQNVWGSDGRYLGQVDRNGNFYDSQGVYRGRMR